MTTRYLDVCSFPKDAHALDFLATLLAAPADWSIIGKDLDGTIRVWNEGARRLYGYEPEEVIGKANVAMLHAPEAIAANKHLTIRAAALRDGRWEGQLVRVRKDGSRFTANVVVTPHHDADGRPVGFLVMSRNITDEKFRLLLESAPDAMVFVNPAGEMVLVNSQAERLFGYSRAELLGQPIELLVPCRHREMHVGHRDGYFRHPKARPMGAGLDLFGLRKDGTEVPVEISLSMLETAEGPLVCSSIRDISDRKKLERFLHERDRELENARLAHLAEQEMSRLNEELERRVVQRTRELEAANKELEAFSYSVSHDLRAPLRAIDGFSRILLKEQGASVPNEVREYLQDIRANTLQMGHLVDDLLAFSRLSRQAIKNEHVVPARLVAQCLDELRGEWEKRQVDVRVGDLPVCRADPSLLKQVWINLLGNALKYTSKRDSAVIEVGSRSGQPPNEIVYFVKDNGVGFDMRYANKLFGVFQRLHRAEDYEGTGVGLAIVQRVIHRHGGRVWAEAAPDKGATFFFTLNDEGSVHD